MTSAFKKLFTDMIHAGGDEKKLSSGFKSQMLKVFVKETHPYFLISDSYFFVPAYFTPNALAEFRDKFSNVNILDLKEKVILITNWNLELKKVNSADHFTSYAGLEVRLIVNSFKPQFQEALHPMRYPTNLYRDDEFKTTIQAFHHQQVQASCTKHTSEMAPVAGGSGKVAQGVIKHSGDDWTFKDGSTKVVSLGGSAKKEAKSTSAPKVKGGASAKAGAKAAAKKASTSVDKVMKFTEKKKTPGKGKHSAKKSVPKKGNLPTPAGKKSKGTTDKMTMQAFKQFLTFHDKKGAKGKITKKSPAKGGKRSAK